MDPSSPAPPADATALVVLVPEADAAVGTMRAAHDPSAIAGMPAHVTVLYPFISESEWRYAVGDKGPDKRLAEVLGGISPLFASTFNRTARFGDSTLYLVPEPSARFAELTRAVAVEFPAWPPYGGAFADIIPHLTIADGSTREVLDRCEAVVTGELPITTHVEEVALFGRRAGRWTLLQRWPLDFPQRGPVIGLYVPDVAEMQLSIVSYQFGVTDASSADWLVVLCGVHASGRAEEWRTSPCLEVADLPRLADFLDAAAAGSSGNLSCTFAEPNLAFVRGAGEGTKIRIRVGFAQEWSLPGVEPTDPHPAYGMPCTWLDFDITHETLRAEAAIVRDLARLWPSRAHVFQRKASAKALRKTQRRNARRPPGTSAPPAPTV